MVKAKFLNLSLFYSFFVLIALLGCSNDDSEPGCYQEDNRRIMETVNEISGIVFSGCNGYSIEPSVRLNDNPLGILSPCNLDEEFQQDGQRVVFSGHIYESFDLEDICADFFEVTDIKIDTATPTSDDLVGFWQLSYYETTEGRIEPPNGDKPVYWRLKYNGLMNGMAGNNFLEPGQYSLDNGLLTLIYGVTEIASTEWEERYYDAIRNTSNGQAFVIPYSLEEGELVLNYLNSDTMHFILKP
ncbi:MAG: hypothetical protein AAGH81_06190 [Bacteroidota bacterium]